jgi:hypothetical protein
MLDVLCKRFEAKLYSATGLVVRALLCYFWLLSPLLRTTCYYFFYYFLTPSGGIIKKMKKENNSKEIMVDEYGREYKKIVILDLDSVIGFEWRVVK